MQVVEGSSPIRVLLIGFGRMGLTHLSILSGLVGSRYLEIVVVDNSLISRRLAKEVLPAARVFRKLSDIPVAKSGQFDYCLITTPPINRKSLIEEASAICESLFIEKPLTVPLGRNQMSGYVLQHAPLNAEVFDCMSGKTTPRIFGRLTTNITFSAVEKGWRAGKFGNVLFEFGGHLLTLIAATCGTEKFLLQSVEDGALSITSQDTDLMVFRFSSAGIQVDIELTAGSSEVRKASYEIEYHTPDNVYIYDLYSLKRRRIGNDREEEVLTSIASKSTSVPFYVRGFEFTAQMEAFLNRTFDRLSVPQINNIENLVERMS